MRQVYLTVFLLLVGSICFATMTDRQETIQKQDVEKRDVSSEAVSKKTAAKKTAVKKITAKISYNRDVRPILATKCFTCHGLDEQSRKADLRLDLRKHALAVITPGKPDESELIDRLTSDDAETVMPPPKIKKAIIKKELAILRQWIKEGAHYDGHWAYQVPIRSPLPKVKQTDWVRNEIDRFVLAKLEAEGLKPSAVASKETLIRRVTLDLTGLPPTPKEVDAFLADSSKNSYERVIDRLMKSPRYGEHMANAWLDAARYADTDGYQKDNARYMHVWRDWVLLAFNKNMPFDQFVIQQIAGDMLPKATLKQQIATGFLRGHRINSEGGAIPAEWFAENLVDRVDTVGTVFMGLTVGCARCHTHKYDPISQTEYYRLFAYFNDVPEAGLGANGGNSPPFVTVPDSWPNLSPAENRKITPKPFKIVKKNGATPRPQPGGPKTVMVMESMKKLRPTYLLNRGVYSAPDKSKVLKPGVPAHFDKTGGAMPKNRLELAKWLVHPKNPLLARVTLNRYWQQFFGVGIVKTSENFGSQGDLPSHPQLLDWLATEFLRVKWDVKKIQKTILMSATYRQASKTSAALRKRDPENRLLARGGRMRLSAYMIRDQALAASGLLVEKLGGPSVKPYMPLKIWNSFGKAKYDQQHGDNLYRRSLYTYWRRTTPPPTMTSFNGADRETCNVRRENTNTPLHALTLLNNITFVEAARFLAERMLREGGKTSSTQIRYGFRLLTGRLPSEQELTVLKRALERFRVKFKNTPAEAQKLLSIGEKKYDKKLDVQELAANTLLASMILNLDETITKE